MVGQIIVYLTKVVFVFRGLCKITLVKANLNYS